MIKVIPLLFLILSCSSLKNTPDTDFSILYAKEFGGSEKSGFLLIENNESYIKFIESLKLDESEYANFLKVDFKKNNVIVLFQGQKMSGGYAINIESVQNDNKTIIVKKKETGPQKGELATTAITTPYCIALIPKGNKTIIE
ncbi:protease complex subunit PrcB family protein [Flavobacterium sp. HXWNR69]|jgi:hypothetical protein|uniref:Protease complex subunit PrcB family protein n=1 Tax=Flavobacterium fragile TaxID=2949085 RepID=A0ABT0THF7_9FLAO|nr:protease complex subunit PrcB family protein [Flavobacterium sp. HXWNR69]MCL9770282.1 protease complex subunit PrcB family protein [Flavobacterium sp. HXWNR69]